MVEGERAKKGERRNTHETKRLSQWPRIKWSENKKKRFCTRGEPVTAPSRSFARRLERSRRRRNTRNDIDARSSLLDNLNGRQVVCTHVMLELQLNIFRILSLSSMVFRRLSCIEIVKKIYETDAAHRYPGQSVK